MPLEQDYINARRYQADQEARDPLMEGIGAFAGGMGSGMVKGVDERNVSNERSIESRGQGFDVYVKSNILYDNETKQPLDFNKTMNLREKCSRNAD